MAEFIIFVAQILLVNFPLSNLFSGTCQPLCNIQSFLSHALSHLWHDTITLSLSLVSVLSAIRFNFGKEWSDFYVTVHKQ